MNLQDFNNDFSVKVVYFDDTSSNVAVHFSVKCLVNNRVSIHTSTADTTQLSEGYNDADVLSLAWNNIKTTVNTWASYNITENPLSDLSITSVSNVIGLSTFNANFTVKVIRFELIPNINPTHWCIQYSISRSNSQNISSVFEGLVPLTQEYCNNTLCTDIANAGWELIKDKACNWALNNMPVVDSVVDTIFTPASI
jgi:hypothetical protein